MHYYIGPEMSYDSPLMTPDGTSPIPDGWLYEFVICADQTGGTQNYATDITFLNAAGNTAGGYQWNIEAGYDVRGYYAYFNSEDTEGNLGVFICPSMQIFSDLLGAPAWPSLRCGGKYYMRIYNNHDKAAATAYRNSATMVGPVAGALPEDYAVNTWNPWVSLLSNPYHAENPMPADAATNVSIDADLGWSQLAHAGYSDPSQFKVYFGTDANPLVNTPTYVSYVSGTTDYSCVLPALAYSTTYYWTVVPFNSARGETVTTRNSKRTAAVRGDAADCPVWHFTTEAYVCPTPDAASQVSPADLATGIEIDNAVMAWNYAHTGDHQDPTGFRLQYSTVAGVGSPTEIVVPYVVGQVSYSQILPTLEYATVYYWKVIPFNGNGDTAEGAFVRQFTTEPVPVDPNPTVATTPNPENGATNVDVNHSIFWEYVSDPLYSDPEGFMVYFGTDDTFVGVTPWDLPYVAGQIGYNIDLPDLAYSTHYFWQVVPYNSPRAMTRTGKVAANRGNAVGCPVWDFYTMDGNIPGTIPPGGYVDVPLGGGVNLHIDPPDGNTNGNIDVTLTPGTAPTDPGYGATDLYYHIEGGAWSQWPVMLTFVWDSPIPPADHTPMVWFDSGSGWEMVNTADIVDYNFDVAPYSISVNVWHFSDWTPGWGPVVPVELVSFAAVTAATNDCVNLTWQTASETDMQGYKILRSESNDVNSASTISPMIAAHNESDMYTYNFQDTDVEIGTYYYWVEAHSLNGHVQTYGSASATVLNTPPTVYDTITKMDSAYPNPFNPTVNVKFSVKDGDKASIVVYNMLGQVVKDFGSFNATHNGTTIQWDGRDNNNRAVCSGVYFFKMKSPSTVNVQKVMLLK